MKLDTDSLAHSRWNYKYHIVFIPKYQRKAIYGQYMQAKVLQHILGHKDITTTYNIYGDVFDRFEFDNIVGADEYLKQQGLSINMS